MGVSYEVQNYHLEYGSSVWSTGVSLGAQKYQLKYPNFIQKFILPNFYYDTPGLQAYSGTPNDTPILRRNIPILRL